MMNDDLRINDKMLNVLNIQKFKIDSSLKINN